ncbi:MAG: hypothetical protein MJ211_12510 [Bacteroidales bacterium]|nr:hypothetical protein [Bacteroidales bacterium]
MKVYVTVLTNEIYIPGLKALKRSLLKVKSKYKLCILLKSGAYELKNLLKENNVLDDYCFLVYSEDINNINNLTEKMPFHRWNETFFKLRVCDLVQFEKIVLLDSDMLIMKNIDSLFDSPSFSAVQADSICKSSYLALNSGLMVLEPSKELYNKLVELIEPSFNKKIKMGEFCGDQDIFRDYDLEWQNKKHLILPLTYNVYFSYLNNLKKNFNYKFSEIFVIHFIGKIKPWELTFKKKTHSFIKMLLHFSFFKIKIFCKYLRYCK